MDTGQSIDIKYGSLSIRRFLATFQDPKMEALFRQEELPRQRRLVFWLCFFVLISMPVFMLSDHLVVKPDPWDRFLLLQRVLHITTCILFLLIIPHSQRYITYDALVFSTVLVFFILLELGSFTFLDDYALYALFDIIIMLSLYAAGILTVKLSAIICLYHSVMAILIVFLLKDLNTHAQIMMMIAYSVSNGAGILLSISHHKNIRRQFLLQHYLREKTFQLKSLAYRDSLTNALNRRSFHDHFRDIEKTASRQEKSDKHIFLIAADIDHFKKINDDFGHDVGDKVLVAFVALIESNIRPTDKIYRFGGEEFMILLQYCTKETALERVEQIMNSLNQNGLDIEELNRPVTCSFGITPVLVSDDIDSVCIRADEALYKAKHNGRNQYVMAPETIPEA
ncbi:MAG: GGDEF domain-containing protein [Saccharospirillaceae bacterium]|nr:GGDEF domain-containing protein [Saccharospirillaceae bacterium]MCD8533137.1 GGDEF domain-containing protein [Saccharospirillaceae bacterium]